ncbi:hypothetical protein BH10ACT1_BH10ACT1_15640 [soil metagenome]
MDVRIGVSQTAKELEVELPDDADVVAVRAELDKAISGGTTFWITDKKGRQVGVPAEKIAYFEIGAPESGRRIGFGG